MFQFKRGKRPKGLTIQREPIISRSAPEVITVQYEDGTEEDLTEDDARLTAFKDAIGSTLRVDTRSQFDEALVAAFTETCVVISIVFNKLPHRISVHNAFDFYGAAVIGRDDDEGFIVQFPSLKSMYAFVADHGPVSVHGHDAKSLFMIVNELKEV